MQKYQVKTYNKNVILYLCEYLIFLARILIKSITIIIHWYRKH